MANQRFAEVVLLFLRDRMVERHVRRLGLDRLLDAPDLGDGLENHLRAAVLLGCKRDALGWLGMVWAPVADAEVPEAVWLQSTHDWRREPLRVAELAARGHNVFGAHLLAAARAHDEGALPDGHTRAMFAGLDARSLERVQREPGGTIWMDVDGKLVCVEGNRRMHALALGLSRGIVSAAEAERWWMWVR